jgi:hypothetical protein
MFAGNYPLLDVFITTIYVVMFILWIMLVFQIMTDIFRSHDLSGVAKALWVLFLFVLPFLGAFIYLITRGGKMHERQIQAVQSQQKAFEDYIRTIANTKE